MDDGCNWKRCRQTSAMGYLGRAMCNKHWHDFCFMQENGRETKARAKIGLPPKGPPRP